MSRTHQFFATAAFLLGASVLLIYPMVFFASLMTLLGMMEFGESWVLVIISQSFLWLSLLYPVFYFGCLWYYVRRKEATYRKYAPYLPFAYIALCFLLFTLWGVVEAQQPDPYDYLDESASVVSPEVFEDFELME